MIEIRPEVRRMLSRWSEALFGLGVFGLGLWVFTFGGWFYGALSLALIALGLSWAVVGARRARFLARIEQAGLGPGVIEITEGHLRYLHPIRGGEISLDELAELRLAQHKGQTLWRLQDLYGHHLWLPVDAAGGADLFDALGRLPGLSSADLVDLSPLAMGQSDLPSLPIQERVIWRRSGVGLQKWPT